MKATEIMIGDWVYRPDCYDQVKEIRQNGIIGLDSLRGLIGFSEIKPIPLTPEILEKNGFKRTKRYNYIYKDNYCEVCVSIVPKIKIANIDLGEPHINVSIRGALFDINMNMSATHELQQIMRLLGIEKEIIL